MGTLISNIRHLLFMAGLAQIALVAASLAIPRILGWHVGLATLRPLLRQMFWTYAAYILVTNFCFGLISVFDFHDLTNHSNLAIMINGFIAVYWISRVLIQFLYFDRSDFPPGKWNRAAEIALVTLFVFLSLAYGLAFYINLKSVAL